jgi:hypothetical protein
VRALLEHLDRLREDNERRSLRQVATTMGLTSGSRVDDILRGRSLPADQRQAMALARGLGGSVEDAERAATLYTAAERAAAAPEATLQRPTLARRAAATVRWPVTSVPNARPEDITRPDVVQPLIGLLGAASGGGAVAVTTALAGAGGFGKTTVARMLVHLPEIRYLFRDGVLWITLGEDAEGPRFGGADQRCLRRAVVIASASERHRKTLETLAEEVSSDSAATTKNLRADLSKQLAELDRQEDRFLDLIGDPDWPQDKIKARLQKVRESKQRINHRLEPTHDDLEPGRAVLLAALELFDRPRDLYDQATDEARKLLNKAIFTRLYIDSTDRRPVATTEALSEPFASLVHAVRASGTGSRPNEPAAPGQGHKTPCGLTHALP